MSREQKILVTFLWGLAVLAMLSFVGMQLWPPRSHAHAPDSEPLPVLFDAPSFELTDQNGRAVSSRSLRGNVWVSMLFFTQCPGICPAMTSRMTDVQKAIPNPDVKFISLSLDPENDTPEVMKLYAEQFDAEQSRWFFLTGPKDTMYEIANGFKLPAQPAKDGTPIIHSQRVLLIDRENRIRGIYDTNDDDSMNQLAIDAKALAAK